MAEELPTNSGPDESDEQFARWVSRYFDQELSPAEALAFNSHLANHPKHRKMLIEISLQGVLIKRILARREMIIRTQFVPDSLDETFVGIAAISEDADESGSEEVILPAPPAPPLLLTPPPWWLNPAIRRSAAAAVFLLLALTVVFYLHQSGIRRPLVTASLITAVDTEWEAPDEQLSAGQALPAKTLYLKKGLAHIQFTNGLSLVVQGPARFCLESNTQADLDLGRMTALVPHEIAGFTVHTPNGDVKDLGTEFGVDVGADSTTRVEVFQGKVEVRSVGSEPELLEANHAARINPSTLAIVPVPLQTANFVRTAQVEDPAYARWKVYSEQLRMDPSLLAYYTFDNRTEDPQSLLNRAAGTIGRFNGQIKNATWDAGRFPGKQSLRFSDMNGFVKLKIPDQLDRFTLAAWVYANRWDPQFNWLMMSDNSSAGGSIHWLVANLGKRIELGLVQAQANTLDNANRAFVDLPGIGAGTWVHLAATFDRSSTKAVLYLNGSEIGQAPIDRPGPVVLGNARIGSWTNIPSHYFDGRFDELAIFNRALSPSEVTEMYQAGLPSQPRGVSDQ